MKKKALGGFVLIIIGVFLVAFHGVSQAESSNELLNPGFEDGEGDWYNWSEGANSGMISDEYNHTGINSACREISGKGMGCFGQIIPVLPGDKIAATAWIMNPDTEALSEGAEGYLRIEFWDEKAPLTKGYLESSHVKAPIKWTKMDVSGKVPDGAKEARVLGFAKSNKSSSKGKVYFDDFEVKIDTASARQ